MLTRLLSSVICPLLPGAALVLSFAPFGMWWLAPLALAALFRLTETAPSVRAAIGVGFVFGVGLFGAGVWWIFLCLHKYAGLPFAAALGASALFVLALSGFPALAAGVGRALPAGGTIARLSALAAAWTLCEWLRGFAFTGFPFLSVGYSQVPQSPLAGLAPVGGVFAVGLATCIAASALAFLMRPLTALASSAAIAVVLFTMLTGAVVGREEWTIKTGSVPAALLQGNVSQDQKWGEHETRKAMADYLQLARDASAEAGVGVGADGALIVLPETALPLRMRDIPPEYLAELAATAGPDGAVIAGMFYQAESGELQNAMVALGDFPPQIYGKRHLVPYGEYLPFERILAPLLRANRIPFSSLSPGTNPGPLRLPFGNIGASVCYEDSFGNEWRAQWPESGVLANITNDAWYDDSAMLAQHMQMARTRALESGRWLARASNTGETALINHRGETTKSIATQTRGFLTAPADLRTGSTPYTQHGDLPTAALSALIILLSAATAFRRSSVNPDS